MLGANRTYEKATSEYRELLISGLQMQLEAASRRLSEARESVAESRLAFQKHKADAHGM
jgi:hypothetical protein